MIARRIGDSTRTHRGCSSAVRGIGLLRHRLAHERAARYATPLKIESDAHPPAFLASAGTRRRDRDFVKVGVATITAKERRISRPWVVRSDELISLSARAGAVPFRILLFLRANGRRIARFRPDVSACAKGPIFYTAIYLNTLRDA